MGRFFLLVVLLFGGLDLMFTVTVMVTVTVTVMV